MIGDGDRLICNSLCVQVPLTMGNTTFTIDFYVLPISGANFVLGIQWLKALGTILTDYANLTIQFQWNATPLICME